MAPPSELQHYETNIKSPLTTLPNPTNYIKLINGTTIEDANKHLKMWKGDLIANLIHQPDTNQYRFEFVDPQNGQNPKLRFTFEGDTLTYGSNVEGNYFIGASIYWDNTNNLMIEKDELPKVTI